MFCPECNTYLDKERNDWFAVSYFLFLGLSSMIDHYTNIREPTEKKCDDLEKAVDIYVKKCVVSGEGLQGKFDELFNELKNKS